MDLPQAPHLDTAFHSLMTSMRKEAKVLRLQKVATKKKEKRKAVQEEVG